VTTELKYYVGYVLTRGEIRRERLRRKEEAMVYVVPVVMG